MTTSNDLMMASVRISFQLSAQQEGGRVLCVPTHRAGHHLLLQQSIHPRAAQLSIHQ